jgi:hypothetical protein
MSRRPATQSSKTRHQPDRTYLAVRRQLQGMRCDHYEVGLLNIESGKMIPRVYQHASVLKAVHWLKSKNAEGHHIYIRPQGSVGLILMDDIGLGTLNRLEADGYKPAAQVETSPSNYQAWIRVSEDPIPEALATKAARILAEDYGADLNSADWRHYGRLAGYTNQKPEYIAEYGKAPYVLAHSCPGTLAERGEELLTRAQARLDEEKAIQEQQAQEVLKTLEMPVDGLADPVAFYRQQLAPILAKYGESVDYSRADWMVGKKMAMLGYPNASIQAAMLECSPNIEDRKKGHIESYVQTTVDNLDKDIEVRRQRSKLAEMMGR